MLLFPAASPNFNDISTQLDLKPTFSMKLNGFTAGYWSFHTIVQLCCVIVKDQTNLNVNQRLSEKIILQEVYHKISSTTCQLSQCDLIAR